MVIPTLNEAEAIGPTVRAARLAQGCEVIVADGGSRDATLDRARAAGARVLSAPRGRARQMNAGAAQAKGELLLFLHADTLLPPGWQHELRRVLALPRVAAGAFTFRLDHRPAGLRFIEQFVALRCCLAAMPYGDQGLFLRRAVFQAVGGFPDLPIMEDCEMVRRLKSHGKIAISPAPALTSARRWRKKGLLATTAFNSVVVAAFYAGFSPALLRRLYDRL